MKDCIFCKIVSKKIPSEIIYENEEFISFLDISPTTEGMTLVVSKTHYDSDFYSNDPKVVSKAIEAARKTSLLLTDKLQPFRVLTAIEGLDVPHLHIKLYPFYADRSPKDTTSKHIVPQPTPEDLKQVADKIRS